jgi:signal transduction histidine kinase
MTAIADLTAIAVQNARLYEATDNALARRVKVVTALNYALSYDLKNLVNSTIGYAGLMETCDSLDEESAEIANRIAVAGDQMAHLIDKLIEVTALSEESPIHHVPCDLVEAVSRAVDDLRDAAAAKSIDVNFQLVGDPYWIKGDATHLYRSVSNLVDNAIRYSPPDAHVSVTLGFWYNDIVIRVCDTGPGIPEDDLPYLFDKYFRGKRSPDGQGGIGLGLELVRATVEAHRGTVVARNVEDHGAEFIITLPTTLRVS